MTFTSFLEGIYDFFHRSISAIDSFGYEVVYPLAMLIIVAWALLILISKSFCYTTKLSKDCDKVTKYLKKLDKKAAKQNKKNKSDAPVEAKITAENVDAFTKKYFGKHCVKNLRERWQTYLKYSAGVPSDFVTGEHCLSKKGVGRGISRGRILAYRYGSMIVTMLAFGYLLFDKTNKATVTPTQINQVLVDIAQILPGIVLLISIALLFDLIINWVFTLADNGAVKNFYEMTKALDDKVELGYGTDAYAQYATYEEPVYADGQLEEPVYDETAYTEEAYQEPVYEETPVEEAPVEEPVYKEFVAPAPVYEEPAPVEEAPQKKVPSKMDKIEMLTEKALSSNASKQTYMGLARMLIDFNKLSTNPDDKVRIKACATKLLAKVK